jgi:hypothetical protein
VPALTWKQRSDYAQVSDCGSYSVAKVRTDDKPFYEAWRTRQHPDGPGMIQTGLPTAEFARKLCAEYVEAK